MRRGRMRSRNQLVRFLLALVIARRLFRVIKLNIVVVLLVHVVVLVTIAEVCGIKPAGNSDGVRLGALQASMPEEGCEAGQAAMEVVEGRSRRAAPSRSEERPAESPPKLCDRLFVVKARALELNEHVSSEGLRPEAREEARPPLAVDGEAAELVVLHARRDDGKLRLDELCNVEDAHLAFGVVLCVQIQIDLRSCGPLEHSHAVVERPCSNQRLYSGFGKWVSSFNVPRDSPESGLVMGPSLQKVRREITHVHLQTIRSGNEAFGLVTEQVPQSSTHDMEELGDLHVRQQCRLAISLGRREVTDEVHRGESWPVAVVAEKRRELLDRLHPKAWSLAASPSVRVEEE
mmetsp:Transcript_117098/g.326220  ORF Transcript_117098/g.326220 Transcript_117098/m.326220 type:complete len:347 (-) Transcript_117098:1323-2363(-)